MDLVWSIATLTIMFVSANIAGNRLNKKDYGEALKFSLYTIILALALF